MIHPRSHDEEAKPPSRHERAVMRSLAFADAAAAEGDVADALLWLQVLDRIGARVPCEYEAKRRAWRARLADAGRA